MTDLLLDLAKSPQARSVFKTLKLPIPLPQPLARSSEPWTARPLEGRVVGVGAIGTGLILSQIARSLVNAGATAAVDGAGDRIRVFAAAGEAEGRPPRGLSDLGDKARLDALVLDATGLTAIDELRGVYDFFHANLDRLARCGRVVVVGASVEDAAPEVAAATSALDGFMRSVAKEIGRKGATSNLVLVEHDGFDRLDGVLRFLLSAPSAFVSAQPIVVTARARALSSVATVRSLDNKLILVTGAARGIGAATARRLAMEGAHVVCVDRPADAAATSQLAREIGGTALLVDVSATDAAAQIIDAISRIPGCKNRGLDVIVHNAGITRDKTLARMSTAQWDDVLSVNLAAVARITAALIAGPEPVLRDDGRVICLSSIAGLAGNVGQCAYAASKAGVVGYVRALSKQLAPRGVTVNAIAPGFIETRLTAAIPVAIRQAARRMSALGQGGEPEDIAQAIAFFASPMSQGITGATLRVCGGALVGA